MEKKIYQTPEVNVIELDSEVLMDLTTSTDNAGVSGSGNEEGFSSRSRLGAWDD